MILLIAKILSYIMVSDDIVGFIEIIFAIIIILVQIVLQLIEVYKAFNFDPNSTLKVITKRNGMIANAFSFIAISIMIRKVTIYPT